MDNLPREHAGKILTEKEKMNASPSPPGPNNSRKPGPSFSRQTRKKTSQRTISIALRVFFAASLVLIASDIYQNTSLWWPYSQHDDTLVLLPSQPQAYLATSSLHKGMDEEGDILALREAYQNQSAQLKALKEALQESHHKQHDIKAGLFRGGNVPQQQQLDLICNKLTEKEQLNTELESKIERLETSLGQSAEQIDHTSQTIEALTVMTETQSQTKQQAVRTFHAQMESLRENMLVEQQASQKHVAEVDGMLGELKEELHRSTHEILALRSDSEKQKDALVTKEQALSEMESLLDRLITDLERAELTNQDIITLCDSSKAQQEDMEAKTLALSDLETLVGRLMTSLEVVDLTKNVALHESPSVPSIVDNTPPEKPAPSVYSLEVNTKKVDNLQSALEDSENEFRELSNLLEEQLRQVILDNQELDHVIAEDPPETKS